jgi:hypothetical protein
MHDAPLVKYPVGRFAWVRWGVAFLGVLSALLTGWLLFRDQIGSERALWSWALLALVTAVAMRSAQPSLAPTWLVWDGQCWQGWHDEGGERITPLAGLTVQADFQQTMLLMLHTQPAALANHAPFPKWVWLYKGFAPAKWHGLRCAVYSR